MESAKRVKEDGTIEYYNEDEKRYREDGTEEYWLNGKQVNK